MRITTLVRNVLASGLAATATSTAALAVVAIAEGKGPAQPLNATSHLLYGDAAARYRDADLDHTVPGLLTHASATLFWALAFETAVAIRPARTPGAMATRAASVGLLAALVDYTITPKRFTPGWELVLSKRAMMLVYAAMAAGFAAAPGRRHP